MSRSAINWNCLFLPISYIIVVDEESKFYYISLYIDTSFEFPQRNLIQFRPYLIIQLIRIIKSIFQENYFPICM